MVNEDKKDKLKRNLPKLKEKIEIKSGVYLFFSFDLVGSSHFKFSNPKEWPKTFDKFYKKTLSNIRKKEHIKKAKVWKYIGDEVLFYMRIEEDIEQLFYVLKEIFSIVKKIPKKLNNNLDLKATAWIADVIEIDEINNDKNFENILMDLTQFSNKPDDIDFLGTDIDIGFRISKFSNRGKLVVGAKLAYLLFYYSKEVQKKLNNNKNLKIVHYEALKGIWNGRKYPIIWYDENWKNLDKMFLYDEHFNSDIIKRVKEKIIFDNKDYKLSRLRKIFKDLNRKKEIEKIIQTIKYSSKQKKDEEEILED